MQLWWTVATLRRVHLKVLKMRNKNISMARITGDGMTTYRVGPHREMVLVRKEAGHVVGGEEWNRSHFRWVGSVDRTIT